MSSPNHFIRLALALILPALGVAALSSPARANVRSVTNASGCQWMEDDVRRGFLYDFSNQTDGPDSPGPLIGQRFKTSYDAQLGISHQMQGGFTLGVTCNVQRNLPLSTAGLSDLEIRFRSLSMYTTPKQISCYALSQRPDGTVASIVHRTVSLPGNFIDHTKSPSLQSSYVTMDFANSVNASASKGLYSVSCQLPSDVGLMSVYSSEVDGIDGN